MKFHVESMSAEFRAGANLLASIRHELEAGNAEHALLLAELAAGPRAEPPLSMNEQAVALLEGRPLPSTSGAAMASAQAKELALRQRLEQLRSMERRISERLEYTRAAARAEAIRLDPRTKQLAKLWEGVGAGARDARDLEREFRTDLLAGAFGAPELPRPEWINVEALD